MLERKLAEIAFEITHKCNLRCEHCYNENNLGLKREMDTKDVKRSLELLKEFGADKIKFGGGEPLMRSDFFEIYDYAKDMVFDVNFSTNGLLIEENIENILSYGVDKLQISLDGIGDVHDRIRNCRGLYDRVESSVKKLIENMIQTNIATTLTKSNANDIENILNFCRENEIYRWKIMKYIPKGPQDPLVLGKEEYKRSVQKLLRYKKEVSKPEIIVAREFDCISDEVDYNDMQCFGGKSFLSVKPDGNITPCSYIDDIICGNIINDTMEKIWNSKEMLEFSNDYHDIKCAYGEKCRGGCKAVSYYTKDEFSCDPYCWVKD